MARNEDLIRLRDELLVKVRDSLCDLERACQLERAITLDLEQGNPPLMYSRIPGAAAKAMAQIAQLRVIARLIAEGEADGKD